MANTRLSQLVISLCRPDSFLSEEALARLDSRVHLRDGISVNKIAPHNGMRRHAPAVIIGNSKSVIDIGPFSRQPNYFIKSRAGNWRRFKFHSARIQRGEESSGRDLSSRFRYETSAKRVAELPAILFLSVVLTPFLPTTRKLPRSVPSVRIRLSNKSRARSSRSEVWRVSRAHSARPRLPTSIHRLVRLPPRQRVEDKESSK